MAKNIEKKSWFIEYQREVVSVIPLLKKWLSEDEFDKFINSFWWEKEKNISTILWFLGKKPLSDFSWIEIKFNELKEWLPKPIEYKISRKFLEKFYEKIKWNEEKENDFWNRFCSKENLNNHKFNFKNLNNLENIDKKILEEIKISNAEMFELLGINSIQDVSMQDLSRQEDVLELLNRELKDTIEKFKESKKILYKWVSDFMTPSWIWNLLENLWLWSKDSDKVSKLKEERSNLESEVWFDRDWDLNPTEKKISISRENKERNISNIDKLIWNKYISQLDKKFKDIFEKLLNSNFNFDKLNEKEKTILAQTSISKNINSDNTFPALSWIDLDKYNVFLKNLYDFENQNDIKIPVWWEDVLNLKIKKSFDLSKHPEFENFENFKNMKDLPMSFEVNIDGNSEKIIQYIENPENEILSREYNSEWLISFYSTKDWNIRIWNWYILGLDWVKISAKSLDDLLDCDTEQDLFICLQNKGLSDTLWKKILWFKKQQDQNDEKLWEYDDWSLFSHYLKNSKVEILERNLIFKWKNINKISQLYILSESELKKNEKKMDNFLWQWNKDYPEESENINDSDGLCEYRSPEECAQEIIEKFNSLDWDPDSDDVEDQVIYQENLDEIQKAIKECEKELKNKKDKETFRNLIRQWWEDNDKNNIVDEALTNDTVVIKPKEIEKKEKTEKEKFEESWNKIDPENSKIEFEVGTRFIWKDNDSELPPQDFSSSYTEFEITNIWAETFTVKLIWWDIKSWLDGHEYELPKTSEQLRKMNNITKYEKSTSNWDDAIKRVSLSKLEKITAFWTAENQVSFNWKEFYKKDKNWKEIPVEYFDYVEPWIESWSKVTQKTILTKYEIKSINPKKWTIKIASNFDWFDETNLTKKVKYQYENEMSFDRFILLVESKNLKWYTKEEQEIKETEYSINWETWALPWRWWLKFVWFWTIGTIFKWIKKSFSDKIKESTEDQKDALENLMFSNEWLNLYKHLWNVMSLWGLLWWVKDAWYECELDYYNNRDSRVWKKIEKWYNKYSWEKNYSDEYGKYLKEILLKWWYKWKDKDRYKFAAAVLTMLKNEWPYPRDFKKNVWKWYRIKAFLDEQHQIRFRNLYEKKKQEIDQLKNLKLSSKARTEAQEDLNKMEFEYIISVIDWTAPYASWDDARWKSIWSMKFKDELKDNLNGYFDKQSESRWKLKTFTAAEEQFLWKMWAWRFNKVLPALEAMCQLVKRPAEIFRLKWYIMASLLMWIIKNNASSDTMQSFRATARSMGFWPLYWARDIEQQDKVRILLDWITQNSKWTIQEFSKTTKYSVSQFDPPHIEWDYTKFLANFTEYRGTNWKNILKRIEIPSYKENEPVWQKSVMDLANDKGNPDSKIFDEIVKNNNDNDQDKRNNDVFSVNYFKVAPWTATNNNIRDYIPQNWKYKDAEKENDATDLRSAVNKWFDDINNSFGSSEKWDKNTVKLCLMKFYNWLRPQNTSTLLRGLSLAQKLKKEHKDKEADYIIWYMIKWEMYNQTKWSFPSEFRKTMDHFYKFFKDHLLDIDQWMIDTAFPWEWSAFKKSYRMLP